MYKRKGVLSFIIKFTAFSVVIVLLALYIGDALISGELVTVFTETARTYKTVIIDAGHGGADGGASGDDGTLEKDCNLAIARKLYALFKASGINAVMTRDEDIMLGDGSFTRAKADDLNYRVKFASKYGDCLYISIHANSFPVKKYSGAQVYYSPNSPASADLAECVRLKIKEALQPENTRTTKRADSSIFLLDKLTVPAVIVECGFLSNDAECALLSSDDYRMKLALCIYAAVSDYLE